MSDETFLQVNITSAAYGTAQVLHGVDFKMGRERVAIVGRNGMGKSTLCKVVTGLHRTAGGSVRLDGTELLGRSAAFIGRAGVGYVPQGRRVFASLTVDEHFTMLGPHRDPSWPPQRVYELFPQLARRRRSLASNLSGGEQQMLAIGRAVAVGPRLLIMDEPSEGLAPLVVDGLIDACASLLNTGDLGILVVEQNLHAAVRLADRIMVMVRGQIVIDMTTGEFLDRPDLQESHLGVSGSS